MPLVGLVVPRIQVQRRLEASECFLSEFAGRAVVVCVDVVELVKRGVHVGVAQ